MNAVTLRKPVAVPEESIGSIVDGGFLASNEQLVKLGNGDIKKGRKVLRMLIADEREQKVHKGPVEKPANVRIATEADEQAVFDLLMVDLAENALGVAPADPDRLMACIRRGTRREGNIVGVIDGKDGKPVAAIVLGFTQWDWSKAYFIVEIFNFVHPDHRQSGYAATLIQFSQWVSDEWSRQFGYQVYLFSSIRATKRAKDKIRFFKRYATLVGAVFAYPTPPEPSP